MAFRIINGALGGGCLLCHQACRQSMILYCYVHFRCRTSAKGIITALPFCIHHTPGIPCSSGCQALPCCLFVISRYQVPVRSHVARDPSRPRHRLMEALYLEHLVGPSSCPQDAVDSVSAFAFSPSFFTAAAGLPGRWRLTTQWPRRRACRGRERRRQQRRPQQRKRRRGGRGRRAGARGP